ncbi:MAG: tetratricopeptide repeat protein [Bdellovibrionales bacterium]|nr:tetratricopeptide repeat protein [Bdellovibrionales bacterium]
MEQFEIQHDLNQRTELRQSPVIEGTAPQPRVESFDAQEFDPQAQNLLLNARVLFRNKEIELAKSLLAESLKLNPENRRALELLRDCFEATHEIANALKINLALEDQREDAILMKKTGDLALLLGQDILARNSYLRALGRFESHEPEVFEVLKNLGNICLRSGDIDGAQEYYHRAFRLQPESESLLVNLGTLEIQRGDFNLAIERFQTALSVQPKCAKAYVGIGMCHRELGDIELAWGNIEQALDIDSSLSTALQLCVAWAMSDGREPAAIQRLQTHLQKSPADDQSTYFLAALFYRAGRTQDAWFETQKLFWINPSHAGLPQLMSDLGAGRAAA